MSTIDLILKYFHTLTEVQRQQFAALPALYEEWNARINVISRKDMDAFMEHHVLHSLAIAQVMPFRGMAQVMDVGTGGGFPGIPLAILFPEAKFLLVDSIEKKTKVVQDVARRIGLQNVVVRRCRAEEVEGVFDFVVSRAVTDLRRFVPYVQGKFSTVNAHSLNNGILYLKGGDLQEELAPFTRRARVYPIEQYFSEPFFETKKVIYIDMQH